MSMGAYVPEPVGGPGRAERAGSASSLTEAARDVVAVALAEDLRYGPDVTTEATVAEGAHATAEFSPRQPGVLAGVEVALEVLDAVVADRATGYEILVCREDGSSVAAGEPVLAVRGDVRALLTAERTALNLLCHLSGIATATAAWTSEVAGTGCAIRDSRKTLPGLRALQKYAVRCGGGVNHRLGLGDAALIKDNHVVAAGSVAEALRLVRARAAELPCEVEVDDMDQLAEALAAGADEILLDNFSPEGCARAVRYRDEHRYAARLEASGGLRLDSARAYARSGVDYLAVGGLTHSSPALDIGMDLS